MFPLVDIPWFDIADVQDVETENHVRKVLDGYGAVVFKRVATRPEVLTLEGDFYDWLEKTTIGQENEFAGRNHKKMLEEWWGDLGCPDNGVITGGSIQQSRFMWNARRLPNVQRAFEVVWDRTDLIHSFDGCGAFREPVTHDRNVWRVHKYAMTTKSWLHVDEYTAEDTKPHGFQGLLNLYNTTEHTGGTVIVPASHHTIDLWVDNIAFNKPTYRMFEDRGVTVRLEPGDLLIWDSRMLHCNTGVSVPTDDPGSSACQRPLRRLVQYVTMKPRPTSDEELTSVTRARKHAIRNGYGGGHDPHVMYVRREADPAYESWYTDDDIEKLLEFA